MRQYEKYWLILKNNKKITLRLPKIMMPPVLRMIRKEKDMDIVFKMETDNIKWRVVSAYNNDAGTMTVTMKPTKFSRSFSV